MAKQIIDQGLRSLSDLQLRTFINHGIYDHLYVEQCGVCTNTLTWNEMLTAAEEYGNCSGCQYQIDKDE